MANSTTIKIPCINCRFKAKEDKSSVWCEYTKFYSDGKIKQVDQRSELKDGYEIVPKKIFHEKDSTCAAKEY